MITFKEFERDAWEKKAARYNDTWGSVTTQPNEAVLNILNVTAGTKFLDCGCGPGHLAYLASKRAANVTGCDYSEAMLEIARKNYPQLTFVHEDAEALSFPDSSFDAVVLNYLLLHVSDQQRALLEAKRILKPGGQLAFTIWISPTESPGLKVMFDAVKKYADMSVIPPAQDIFMFADSNYAREFLGKNGFFDFREKRFESCWKVASPEAFFSAVQAGTRIGGLIDLQQASIKEQIRVSIEKEIQQFKTSNDYVVPTPSLIFAAKKAPT